MVALKKYDFTGKQEGEIAVEDKLLKSEVSGQMIKDYLVAIHKNARQWSANTKTRSEVKCTKKKPHQQKGLGRARQGSFAAPHYKGGGVAFGPKPKANQHIRINRKERQLAIRHMIIEKIKANETIVLKDVEIKEPKTKPVADFFRQTELISKRTLVIGEKSDLQLVKSMRNIPKKEFRIFFNMNGYDLALCQNLVIMESAVEELLSFLRKGSEA